MGHFTPILLTVVLTVAALQRPPIDWKAADQETLRHVQALLKFDTSDPPGHEKPAVDYLKDQERILEAELYRFVKFHYELAEQIAGRR